MSHEIIVSGVRYSTVATETPLSDDVRETIGFDPYQHQIDFLEKVSSEMDEYKAKRSGVYFLEAATGGGKTLTMLLPTLMFDASLMIAYPTNALIEDQKDSILSELDKMGLADEINVEEIYSKKLYDYAEENDLENAGDALYQFLQETATETTIYLTNPDTIYNAYFDRYGEITSEGIKGMISSELIPFLAFDEFHLYNIKEHVAVYSILTYHKAVQKDRIFLFSSATPDEEFFDFIKKLDGPKFNVKRISDDRDDTGESVILQPVDLKMKSSEKWKVIKKIKEESEQIIERLENGDEVAVIMDSAAQADRFYQHISDELEEVFGKEYIENHCSLTTGLRGKESSLKPNDPKVKLAVGTQPLSVGINFDVDHLIFESRRAPDFIQKLGRVGRGKGGSDIEKATATCYIPGRTIDEIEKKTNGKTLQREKLESYAKSYFPGKKYIFEYLNKFAPLEFIKPFGKEKFEEGFDWEKYNESYYQAFDMAMENAKKRIKKYKDQFESEYSLFENSLYSFRGTSGPVLALIIKSDHGKDIGVYDIYHILRHYEHRNAEVVDEDQFKSMSGNPQLNKQLEKGIVDPLAYVKLNAEDRLENSNNYNTMVECLMDSTEKIDIVSNVKINPEKGGMRTPLLTEINQELEDRKFLMRACTKNEFNKIKYKLPYLFKTITVENMLNKEYKAAFGTGALYLDSLLGGE